MREKLKNRIRLIPAVAEVLIEYEKKYGREEGRRIFDYMVERIVDAVIDEIKGFVKREWEASIESKKSG